MSGSDWLTFISAYIFAGAIFVFILVMRRSIIELNTKRKHGWKRVIRDSRKRYLQYGVSDEVRYMLYGLVWPVSLFTLAVEGLVRYFFWIADSREKQE